MCAFLRHKLSSRVWGWGKSWASKSRLQLGSQLLFLSMQPEVGQSWPVAAGPEPKIHHLQTQNSQLVLWTDVGKLSLLGISFSHLSSGFEAMLPP